MQQPERTFYRMCNYRKATAFTLAIFVCAVLLKLHSIYIRMYEVPDKTTKTTTEWNHGYHQKIPHPEKFISSPCSSNDSAWDMVGEDRIWSVVFADHRPGVRRAVDINRLHKKAQIIVTHDTQSARRYKWDIINPKFKYVQDLFSVPHARMYLGGAPDAETVFNDAVNLWKEVLRNGTKGKIINSIIAKHDPKHNAYGSHLRLLLSSVAVTTGPILEMGMGNFSTVSIIDLISKSGRYLLSTDTNLSWLNKFKDKETPLHQVMLVPVYSDGIGCF